MKPCKKIVALLLALAMSAVAFPMSTIAEMTYPLGDIDLSGDVGAEDLTKLARAVGQIEALPDVAYETDGSKSYPYGDVDLSGDVGASDLTALARAVGKIEALPATNVRIVKKSGEEDKNTTYRIQNTGIGEDEEYNVRLAFTNPTVADFPDPEIHRFTDENGKPVYWIYGTGGNNIRAAYSTDNMKTWTRINSVVDTSTLTWIDKSNPKLWAPSCLYKDGKYYLSFSNGDSHTSNPNAGINITVSDNPGGPFKAFTSGPVVWEHDENYSDMALIDQDLFLDEDGQIYMYYGGGGICLAVKLKDDLSGLATFPDGSTYKKMEGLGSYMEGPYMIKRGSTYYLMYSKGIWSNDSYGVCYATSDSPIGPFTYGRQILATDDTGIHKGPGHHSAIYLPENNEWLICYHRWNKTDSYRSTCIDRMVFNKNGSIRAVVQTDGWTTDDDFGPDKSNLALSATASDSGYKQYGEGSVSALCDGDEISYWQYENQDAIKAGNCYAQLNFAESVTSTRTVIKFESGTKPKEDGYRLQYSTDGKTWKAVPDVAAAYGDTLTLTYPAVSAAQLRFVITANVNEDGKYSTKIYEWQVFDDSAPAALSLVNPIIDHDAIHTFYGDPEIHEFDGKYYIYSTTSRADRKQTNMDVFVSDDLVTWTQKKDILNMADFPQTTGCIWAPSVIKRGGYYYISFSINDIQSDSTTAGLMMARSTSPEGPFVKYFDGPFIGRYIYGAQPIDGNFFEDDDGTVYFYYGGHANCNVCVLNETMDGFIPFEKIEQSDDQAAKDAKTFISLTKTGNMKNYVEGSFMVKKDGVYYLMWSVGSYTDATYGVEYATGSSPTGPFTYQRKILETDLRIASGPGHHSCLYLPEYDTWILCYHRREPDAAAGTDRRLCIDRLVFEDGQILPVKMTDGWTLGEEDDEPTDVNLARIAGATYAASSSANGFGAAGAFDDCAADKHRWAQGSTSAGQWLSIDFGKQVTFNSIGLTFESVGANKFTLQTSENGTNWTNLAENLSVSDLDLSVKGRIAFFYFPETTSRYLRLYFPNGSAWLSVYEWEVYRAGTGKRSELHKEVIGGIDDLTPYTAASGNAYRDALAYAATADARTEAAQKEIAQALKYLKKAKRALVERPAAGENLAPLATPSASFTKTNGMLAKLNDGIDSADNRWTEHTNPSATCATVQYDFEEAVTLGEMQIKWYRDGSELWVPASLDIQYFDGKEYVSVTPTNTWKFTGNAYDTYLFTPVTSTSFRLVPTRQSGKNRFVGINEWKVF